jgi:hypothetical protein
MGLFDQIASAIDNPNQQANPNQLNNILNVVQQLGGSRGIDPSTTQNMLSIVGSHVRSALQEKRSIAGGDRAEALVEQYGGTTPDPRAVQSVFTPQQQQAVVQDAVQRTGLNSSLIQSLLPILVPIVLNLLQSGAANRGQQGAPYPNSNPNPNQGTGSNSVLGAFLDADRDGEVDIGDAISIASQFLGQRQRNF